MAWWRIVFSVGVLAVLAWFAVENPPANSIAELHANPQKYFGKSVTLYVETCIDSIAAEKFRVREGEQTIWVHGVTDPAWLHHNLSLDGILTSDFTVQLNRIHIYQNRRWIIVFSLLALLLLFLFGLPVLIWRHGAFEVDEYA